MAIGDLWKLSWDWVDSNTGKTWTSGITVQTTQAGDPTIAAYAGPMEAWWTAIKPFFHSSTVLSLIALRKIKPNDGTLLTKIEAVAGTGATGPLPPDTAIVTSLRTAKAGRSYRGRTYLPAPAMGQLTTGGDFVTASAADVEDAYENLDAQLAALVLNGANVSVYSKQHNKTAVETVTRVLSYQTDVNFRRQGRRQTRAPAYAAT